MNKLIAFIITVNMVLMLSGTPRGTTQMELPITGNVVGQAQPFYKVVPFVNEASSSTPKPGHWVCTDSLKIKKILPAGGTYGAQFYAMNNTMQTCGNLGYLCPEAEQAIAKAPVWVRPDLENVLRQLELNKQIIYAGIINQANDPYVDEIAFSIAHSSVIYLSSVYANPQLFTENAQKIYEIDNELSYVQIIDYGSSASGGNYYSTTRYFKLDANGQTVQVEVPHDIYYWYLVHPKLTDEIPAYIDPSVVENNTDHDNNIALPPTGKFWRSYFYNVQEDAYPALRDTLMQCQTLFNRNGTSGDALRAVQYWVNHTMSFTSNSERPHQPVRIYRKHFGRCGEYADYTSAASRTALIPCTSILSASCDHTWNEFWEDGWVQWEPVNGYIDVPLVYEDGWGKVFGSVFEIRSDGFLTSVTDRYSFGISVIAITVTDSLYTPVDGARVILAINDGGTLKTDMVGFTDNSGNCTLFVGENRHYCIRVTTPFGSYPSDTSSYAELVENSVFGEVYPFQIIIPTTIARPQITLVNLPVDSVDDYRLSYNLSSPNQILSGIVTWDDIDVVGVRPLFYKWLENQSRITVQGMDADNYMFNEIADMGDAFIYDNNVLQSSGSFNIPVGQDWHIIVDNSYRLNNAQYVEGTIRFETFTTAADDDVQSLTKPILYRNYPNPFNPQTTIAFILPESSPLKLDIYNLKGQHIKSLLNDNLLAGKHSVVWDGTDDNCCPVASGVYFYRMKSTDRVSTLKMLLMK